MSIHVTEQTVQNTAVAQSSPPEPSGRVENSVVIPDSIPEVETTIYRDTDTVLRVRPTRSSSDECCLTMYWKLTDQTQNITAERTSYRYDTEIDRSPTMIDALSGDIHDRYVETVETLTNRFDFDIVRPTSGCGICSYRLESLDTYPIAAFETRFG